MALLDFNSIRDGLQFESLTRSYFLSLKDDANNNIIAIDPQLSGVGQDGGVDLLVKMKLSDTLKDFDRVWVVQCKFHKKNISTNILSDVNIPGLIYSYKAHGYLLVSRSRPTSKLTDYFQRLEDNCKERYKYMILHSDQYLEKLQAFPKLIEHYFQNNNR